MGRQIEFGIDGTARDVNNIYIGAGGVARKVKAGYIGVNGVARQFYPAVSDPVPLFIETADNKVYAVSGNTFTKVLERSSVTANPAGITYDNGSGNLADIFIGKTSNYVPAGFYTFNSSGTLTRSGSTIPSTSIADAVPRRMLTTSSGNILQIPYNRYSVFRKVFNQLSVAPSDKAYRCTSLAGTLSEVTLPAAIAGTAAYRRGNRLLISGLNAASAGTQLMYSNNNGQSFTASATPIYYFVGDTFGNLLGLGGNAENAFLYSGWVDSERIDWVSFPSTTFSGQLIDVCYWNKYWYISTWMNGKTRYSRVRIYRSGNLSSWSLAFDSEINSNSTLSYPHQAAPLIFGKTNSALYLFPFEPLTYQHWMYLYSTDGLSYQYIDTNAGYSTSLMNITSISP